MVPGAGGTAEFTQAGQSAQPGTTPNGQTGQQMPAQAPPPYMPQGAQPAADPGRPPWAQ